LTTINTTQEYSKCREKVGKQIKLSDFYGEFNFHVKEKYEQKIFVITPAQPPN
jgi:hypothetical protein